MCSSLFFSPAPDKIPSPCITTEINPAFSSFRDSQRKKLKGKDDIMVGFCSEGSCVNALQQNVSVERLKHTHTELIHTSAQLCSLTPLNSHTPLVSHASTCDGGKRPADTCLSLSPAVTMTSRAEQAEGR